MKSVHYEDQISKRFDFFAPFLMFPSGRVKLQGNIDKSIISLVARIFD